MLELLVVFPLIKLTSSVSNLLGLLVKVEEMASAFQSYVDIISIQQAFIQLRINTTIRLKRSANQK